MTGTYRLPSAVRDSAHILHHSLLDNNTPQHPPSSPFGISEKRRYFRKSIHTVTPRALQARTHRLVAIFQHVEQSLDALSTLVYFGLANKTKC